MLLKVEKFYRCSVVLRATSLLALGYLVLSSLKALLLLLLFVWWLSPTVHAETKHHRNFATLQSYIFVIFF